MTIFVCVDDNNGMLFNRRRQSRDEAVLEDMVRTAGQKIWMNEYSSKLFQTVPEKIIVEEDFLACAGRDGCCFLENIPLKPYEDKLESVVVYYWNRVYPADTYLDIDLSQNWKVEDTKEFGGTSHEKITRKLFKRKEG